MPDVLMVGTGEYTTGYVHNSPAKSDKKIGVVALTMFDLRRRGLVGKVSMAGRDGTKFPGIRSHLKRNVADVYRDMDVQFNSFPADDVTSDPGAYREGLRHMPDYPTVEAN